MEASNRALISLAVGCALAAAFFGFGVDVFSWRSSLAGDQGRVQLLQAIRLAVLVILAVVLVLRGGWRGAVAAIGMAFFTVLAEWALFPYSFEYASLQDPSGFDERFGEAIQRPSFLRFIAFDVVGVAVAAALTQVLRTAARTDPRDPWGSG